MNGAPPIKRHTVVTGHYGTGKTNLSVNLALDLVERYGTVTLVDLDIVNPYFRSSDYARMLGTRGVHVISPSFAGTTLETPSISAAVYSAFSTDGAVVFDVGGDDVGATAIGRFARDFARIDHDVLYVVNRHRNLTGSPGEAVELLREIEAASHLTATGIVANSHLQSETTVETIVEALPFAEEVARLSGLPLMFATAPERLVGGLLEELASRVPPVEVYPAEVYVRTPWDLPEVDEEVD